MIKLEGFPEYLELVKGMGDKMKKQQMANIIRNNLKPVATSIKNNTPLRKEGRSGNAIIRRRKDGTQSTSSVRGNLRASVGVKTFSKGEEVSGYAGPHKRNTNDGWYGFFVERGTKTQPATHFIERAANMSVPLAKDALEQDITNYIKKNGQKLGLDIK